MINNTSRLIKSSSVAKCIGLFFLIAAIGFSQSSIAAEKKVKSPRIPTYPLIVFETTEGDFILELDGKRAPLSVKNFVEYVRAGHYDGTIFHRVISGFMVQAGGYDEDLAEKPTKDPIPNESGNGLSNKRGTVAMARLAMPHSATAQFYINVVDNEKLDPRPERWGYTVIGEVKEGMDIIDKIAEMPTGVRPQFGPDVPEKTITIVKATVRLK